MTVPIYKAEDVINGRFQVLSRRATGGMAVVYRVKELDTENVYALKAIDRESYKAKKRLRAEFATLSKLNHPNIVKVYEWGEDEDCAFFTMDLIRGERLFDFIAKGMGTLRESLEIYSQLLYTVARLHELKIVHRDLKPDNIYVSHGGKLTLIDFGICRSPDRGEITSDDDMTGTLQFVSPEGAAVMLGNKSGRLRRQAEAPKADVYALGAILYHLLTGKWPHGEHGESADLRLDFLRTVRDGKPRGADFMFPELGRVAMAMLLPADHGRPANALDVIPTFEAAFAAVAGNNIFSPLCAENMALLMMEAQRDAARAEAEEVQAEDMTAPEVSLGIDELATEPAPEAESTVIRYRPHFMRRPAVRTLAGMAVAASLAVLVTVKVGKGPEGEALVMQSPAMEVADPVVVDHPRERDGEVWEVTTDQEMTAGVAADLLAMVLEVNLITGPLPAQKLYPCNAAKKQLAWKGGCWHVMLNEGADRKERVAGCKDSPWYEPEKGYCEKSGGYVYTPVPATEKVKPPVQTVDVDPPISYADPKGHGATGGSGK